MGNDQSSRMDHDGRYRAGRQDAAMDGGDVQSERSDEARVDEAHTEAGRRDHH